MRRSAAWTGCPRGLLSHTGTQSPQLLTLPCRRGTWHVDEDSLTVLLLDVLLVHAVPCTCSVAARRAGPWEDRDSGGVDCGSA